MVGGWEFGVGSGAGSHRISQPEPPTPNLFSEIIPAVKRILVYWLPVAVWAAVILNAAGPSFDDVHTGSAIHTIFSFLGVRLSFMTAEMINIIIRKLAHVTEYAILGALAFRAVRAERHGWILAWSVAAVIIATAVATADESLQSLTPTRTATPRDVLLDATGATIAQLILRFTAE
jgi:VanZ family protein